MKRRSQLFTRTLLLMFFLFGIIALSTSVLSGLILYEHMTKEYLSKGRAIARSIATSNVEVILNRDASTIQSMIDNYLEIEGAAYVFVEDSNRRIISHTFVPQIPEEVRSLAVHNRNMVTKHLNIPGVGDIMDIAKPILAGEGGYVHVGMDMDLIRHYIWSAIFKMQTLVFFIFWGSVIVLYMAVRKISQPLTSLTQYAERLLKHDFSAGVNIKSRDEIGLLARTMESMAGELSGLIIGLEQTVSAATSELQDTLAYLTAIIDNIADGLLVVDEEGKVTSYNPALSAMFDFGDVDLAGKDVAALFSAEIANLADKVRRYPGEIFSAETAMSRGRIGKAAAGAIHKAGPGDFPGRFLGAVILIRDITVEKEVDLMKTDFISTVSHELRTPLTSVLGFAKIIKKKLATSIFPAVTSTDPRFERNKTQVNDNINIIVSEGERLTELINDVLDIAKMESGKLEWRRHPVSMADVIRHSVTSTKALLSAKGLRMSLDIDENIPEILGDRDRLVQVMVNLISNAVKFTHYGKITCSASFHKGIIKVSVADTGIGIPPKDQSRIFDRFKQAGDTMTEKPKGTGLGLPICKEILEHHGGQIWVESVPGSGSTFYFTIPLTSGMDRALPEHHYGFLGNRAPGVQPLIMVVDDDPAVRQYMTQLLSGEKYRVLGVASGEQALQLARVRLPDLITMDLLMPGMDGETTITHLQEDRLTKNIPIILLTAAPHKTTQATETISKPINDKILLQTIKALLNKKDKSRP